MNPVERLIAVHRKPERLAVGLMSGMSMDGLDLALVRVSGAPPTLGVDLVASDTVPYDDALRARLRAAVTGSAAEACRLSFDLGDLWAREVLGFLGRARTNPADVDLLGSHGQTLHHTPRAQGGGRAATLQVGDGDVLAERTGILTVSDFRARDVAAGGEGAPLIPYADWCLWARPGAVSACVNLGSIANVTVVTERPEDVLAFDMGPANALIDGFARGCDPVHAGIDRDGQVSASGRVNERMLTAMLERRAKFFDAPPPKSAGFDDFGPALAADLAREFAAVDPRDRVRTAVEATAVSVAQAFARHVKPRFPALRLARFSGGGTRNPTLMRALADRLRPLGIAAEPLPDEWSKAKEAVGFALLADATVRGLPSNMPGATGAARATVLGKISLGRSVASSPPRDNPMILASKEFPPALRIGARVWSNAGYRDHGPLEGPKTDIPAETCGAIVGTSKPYFTYDHLLYEVHWASGQKSKHYASDLYCIGRFSTRAEFENAIRIVGFTELTVGPQGGFRVARIPIEFDGARVDADITDRDLWVGTLERKVRESGFEVRENRLPRKSRAPKREG